MSVKSLVLSVSLAAAGLFGIGASAVAFSNDTEMTLEAEIAAERSADLDAAEYADVWLEPEDFEDTGAAS